MIKNQDDDIGLSQDAAALRQVNMRCVRETSTYCCWSNRRFFPGAETIVTSPRYKQALISCKLRATVAQINRPQSVLEGQMFDLLDFGY